MATQLELLSPAGNADIGIAAIDHGADAVYVGAPRFTARAGACNTLTDISRLIGYAHLYYAKVYVALNTILTDSELPEALAIIHEIFRLGADGLILQDVGLLELSLPPIPLIASTQMHNDSLEKVRFLEAVGFRRVILARELSLDDITAIRNGTTVELETFVHGALCVSYSGQCYMSQAVTGRSGNRGVCAQPCRSRYTLTDGRGSIIRNDKFLLSLKDLNRMKAIPDLISAGITSFKIEGRYKGIEYVKNVTAAYRQAIDRFINSHQGYRRSSSGTSTFTFSPDTDKTFNRRYTSYFLFGRGKERLGSIDTQKSVGRLAGRVVTLEKNSFQTDGLDLHAGDGLCFFTKGNELAGLRVDRVAGATIYPNNMKGLAIGIRLYRNHDAAFTRILNKPSASRRIAVEMDFIHHDVSARLVVRDEDGNRVETALNVPFQPARDAARASKQVEVHLSSTGNTPYRIAKLRIHQQPGFLPVSALNSLRRTVLESLTRVRYENYPRQINAFEPNIFACPRKRLDFRANVLNESARQFYSRHGVTHIEPAFETLSEGRGKAVMTTRYCLRHQLDLCHRYNRRPNHSFQEPFRLSDKNHTYRLEFDCRHCRMHVILEK